MTDRTFSPRRTSFAVVTWNVLYQDAEARLPLLAEKLHQHRPDIVLLQESSCEHATTLAAAMGMLVAAVPGDSGTSVPAVLVRKQPIRAAAVNVAAGSARLGDSRPYYYVYADINMSGRVVRCATTHLQHTRLAGRMQIDEEYRRVSREGMPLASISNTEIRESVARRLDQLEGIERVRKQLAVANDEIFGGDFNFVPRGLEYNRVLSWGLRDSWFDGPRQGSGATIVEANPLLADGVGAYAAQVSAAGGTSGELDYTLDFQFCSPSLRVGMARTIGDGRESGQWPSDHLGIAVEYSLCGSS